jgi:hypothetical protein
VRPGRVHEVNRKGLILVLFKDQFEAARYKRAFDLVVKQACEAEAQNGGLHRGLGRRRQPRANRHLDNLVASWLTEAPGSGRGRAFCRDAGEESEIDGPAGHAVVGKKARAGADDASNLAHSGGDHSAVGQTSYA